MSQVVISPDPDLADVRRAYWDSRLEGIREIVSRAVAREEIRSSLDPRFVMEMCAGPMMMRRTSGQTVTRHYIKKLVERVVPVLRK